MKQMTKVLEDVMKPKLIGHVSCSAQRLALWYTFLAFKAKKSTPVPGNLPVSPSLRARKARV